MFVLWLIFGALIGAIAANTKGFSMAGGVIGGILLGLFSPLLFLVSGTKKAEPAAAATRKCPYCAETVSAEAVLCKHCKSVLEPVPVAAPIAVAPTKAAAADTRTPEQVAKDKRAARIAIVGVLVIGGGVLAAVVATQYRAATGRDGVAVDDLEDSGRAVSMAFVIRGAGEACVTASRVYKQGTDSKTGDTYWNVSCRGGRDYTVTVKADGSTKVMTCALMKTVANIECFRPIVGQ